MSDANDAHPADNADDPRTPDDSRTPDDAGAPEDAWAQACAEDLAAEEARRAGHEHDREPGRGDAADELRRLVDSVAERIADVAAPLMGAAGRAAAGEGVGATAEQLTRRLAETARNAFDDVADRSPEVVSHLSAAGAELLAAYRAAVAEQERRWTRRDEPCVRVTRDDEEPQAGGDEGDEPPPGTERIDVD
ncbi:DUF5304 family protein [Streptomyces alkaliterrae]|uniref:DUF5304 family protein n=1 Tax=Streptomyces alkaliterrae TaxID=2213162 RepID=A0A5P0YUW0_9ACTN|nr:DUF5304 family protein [Streptomyces alkaliterrae]MBB1255280.1 DUF5304 family protein [Streptomyces alkaliterrae]MBB1261573.1 DUF5304 family protein [Streptomyces alkaliterrae]MQS04085.1 hypothetical protein [Streptomyces alkaliterrae]